MIERQHGEHPVATAEAGDTDLLPLQIIGRLDLLTDREGADELIDESGDEHAVEPVDNGAQASPRSRAKVKMRLTCG